MTPTPPIAAVPAQPDAIPVQTLIELHQGLAANLHDGPARNLHLATAAALTAQGAAERAVPAVEDVDLPDAEDMAHSAVQEALSFGLSHQVVHKWMRHIQDQTVKAMLAAPAAQTEHVAADVSQNGLESNMTGGAYAALQKKHSDFVETVGLMLDAIGYKEDYARQWPKEKASITFKRWFDEQLASHAQAPAGAQQESNMAAPAQDERGPTYLCQAWGETDLPSAAIVHGLDGVRAFLIEQWLGDADHEHDDGTKALPAAMEDMQKQWAIEGEAWNWSIDFEIGGISVQRVDDVGAARAAAPVAPAQPGQEGERDLPKITAEDRSFLHYNPNTDDIVKWVHDYAKVAIDADRAARAAAPVAPAGGNEQKALAALRYYMTECSGTEPSISVFHRMVDEALEAAPAPGDEQRDELAVELRRIAHKPGSVAVSGTLLRAAAALESCAAPQPATADALTALASDLLGRAARNEAPGNELYVLGLREAADAALAAQRGGA